MGFLFAAKKHISSANLKSGSLNIKPELCPAPEPVQYFSRKYSVYTTHHIISPEKAIVVEKAWVFVGK